MTDSIRYHVWSIQEFRAKEATWWKLKNDSAASWSLLHAYGDYHRERNQLDRFLHTVAAGAGFPVPGQRIV